MLGIGFDAIKSNSQHKFSPSNLSLPQLMYARDFL
jgi:hypothetical protein